MRRKRSLIRILALLVFVCLIPADFTAQGGAQERANALRAQLVERQAKQANLEARLSVLEEELKPENIERSLAGVGSTHPEELREVRRRQLEQEKTGIQTQLRVLADGKTRLEAGIAQADADAYHQSAGVIPASKITARGPQPSVEQPSVIVAPAPRRVRRTRNKQKRRRIHRLIQD